ncbi:MAG: hypothetical protein O8C66_12770 [Candidatus Methanoperedens sp.]|nr:hypothetical protein [Candidatus Methanoperedens sp.]MCZ7371373.1 hypothetical protein [Candidatus Methanoperedens sp.]
MNRPLICLLLLLAVALSGCTGSSTTTENGPAQMQKIEHANANLDGKIVDVKFFPTDARAGEVVTAELIVANTGTEVIKNESVDIKVKLKTLDDFMANMYLKTMSDEKKTRTLEPLDFDTEIQPEMNKPISAVFHTVQEMQGRSLAGTYEITINLSVNREKVESNIFPITLHSGTIREFTPIPTPSPTPTPIPTHTPTPTPTITETETPTPTPTPEIVATPTGMEKEVRIVATDKFGINQIQINPGDAILFNNREDDTYTLVESDHKMANITVSTRVVQIFNTTGDYHFALIRPQMHTKPSELNVTVRVNASQ